jgi:hypothetical protein
VRVAEKISAEAGAARVAENLDDSHASWSIKNIFYRGALHRLLHLRRDGHASSLALSPAGVVSYVSCTPSAAPNAPPSPPDAREEAPRAVPRHVQPPWPIRDGPVRDGSKVTGLDLGPTGPDLGSVIFYFFKNQFSVSVRLSNRHHRWFLVTADNSWY